MTDAALRMVWVAPQRVGSTVFLNALGGQVTYLDRLFRKRKQGARGNQLETFARFPEFERLRNESPMKALDYLQAQTQEPFIFKLEYPLLFSGGDQPDDWRQELFDVLCRPELTIIHGWRRDLFRRFVSMVSARRSGVMNLPAGEQAAIDSFEVTESHAIQNIERILDQTRRIRSAYATRKVHYIDYREIADRSVFGRLRDEIGMSIDNPPEYKFVRLIRDPREICLNYDAVRDAVIDRFGPWVVDCDIETL